MHNTTAFLPVDSDVLDRKYNTERILYNISEKD